MKGRKYNNHCSNDWHCVAVSSSIFRWLADGGYIVGSNKRILIREATRVLQSWHKYDMHNIIMIIITIIHYNCRSADLEIFIDGRFLRIFDNQTTSQWEECPDGHSFCVLYVWKWESRCMYIGTFSKYSEYWYKVITDYSSDKAADGDGRVIHPCYWNSV